MHSLLYTFTYGMTHPMLRDMQGMLGSVVDLTTAVGKAGLDVTRTVGDVTKSVGEASFNATVGVTQAVANPLVDFGTSVVNDISNIGSVSSADKII